MTRIDFYILKDSGKQADARFACRLAGKIFAQGHHLYINTQSNQQLQAMDQMLWTFRDRSFLPHAIYDAGNHNTPPILLGHGVEPDHSHDVHDVMVNLADEVPSFFSRFERVAELVTGDNEQRQLARQRYRFYKERGYVIESHKIES